MRITFGKVKQDVIQHLEYKEENLNVIENFEYLRKKQDQFEYQYKWRGFYRSENDWLEI